MGGLESLLNPCARLDTQLHPVLDPGVRSSLEYEYSVTQSSPGDYCYVKWWCSRLILQANPRQKGQSGNTQVAPKDTTPVFPDSPKFLVPRVCPLPVFDGLTVFRPRGTKNTGYAWLSPCCGLVTRPHGPLFNRC